MPETTALRLKRIMNERRLKQVDILRMCEPYCKKYNMKLTKSDLSQFVNGKVQPGQWKITILSLALNVSEAWLMGYDVPIAREIADQFDLQTFAEPPAPRPPRGARILSSCAEVMQPDELDRAIGMMKIMFPQYNDILERKEDDNEP